MVTTVVIELHVASETDRARDIEAAFIELVVAHTVVESERSAAPVDLPAVHENGRWYGPDELDGYLADLRTTVALWRKYQSDACYIEDDGSIC